MVNGAPDYTAATIAARSVTLKTFQSRLAAIDPDGWPVEQQVDHALVGAMMNGLDFDLRVLRPWARDPAFYQSIWTDAERHARARRADASRRHRARGRTRFRCRRPTRRGSPRSSARFHRSSRRRA